MTYRTVVTKLEALKDPSLLDDGEWVESQVRNAWVRPGTVEAEGIDEVWKATLASIARGRRERGEE